LVGLYHWQLRLFDIRAPFVPVHNYEGHVGGLPMPQLVVDPTDTLLFSGTFLEPPMAVLPVRQHPLTPRAICVLHLCNQSTAGTDNALRCWSVQTGRLIRSWSLDAPVGGMTWSVDCASTEARDGLMYACGTKLYHMPIREPIPPV